MINSHDYLQKDLEYHLQLEKKIEKRLNNVSEWDNWTLNLYKKGNSAYYYACHKENNQLQRKYLGRADGPNAKTITTIRRRHFLKRELARCRNDISALRYFLKHYKGISPEESINKMGKAYRSVLNEVSDVYNLAANSRWLKENNAVKLSYPPYYPDDLIHRAPDGTLLRSKAEVIIYVILVTLGVPFVYELPRMINGILYHPDFTILNKRTGEEILIEYMGRFTDPQYREDNTEKICNFFFGDYVLGRNFFIFMDDAKGHIDADNIRKVLEALTL